MTRRVNKVTFLSPGTFVFEQETRTIGEWNVAAAADMAATIVARYGAAPFAFYFTTDIVSSAVDDGEGGELQVEPKEVARSPMHYLGGEVLTYDEVERRADPKEDILRSNMRGNGIALVLENRNSYKSTHNFGPTDLVVDRAGSITDRGDAPKWVAYRKEFAARSAKENGR